MEKVVFGIDPGIGRTGFGVVYVSQHGELEALDFGCIVTEKILSRSERLRVISDDLTSLIEKWKPNLIAIEELYFAKNKSTAIDVSHARGVVLLTAEKAGIPIVEFSPPQIKLAITGNGRADKCQVKLMVKALLKLKVAPTPDDAADALATAICHTLTRQYETQT